LKGIFTIDTTHFTFVVSASVTAGDRDRQGKRGILNNSSERLFAELLGENYLKGFVFHSPRHGNKLEYEAGDVVLWIRTQIIVFEIMWRDFNLSKSSSTKSFLKAIGEKRKQLEKDYNLFSTVPEQIKMKNEIGELVSEFSKQNFYHDNFSGVIIIDSEQKLEKLNYLTYKKTLESEFPISIFTKSDFLFLISEADTIPDLTYYLHDRFDFLKMVFENNFNLFLNTDSEIEKNLIAFYKMNDYQFPIDKWEASEDKNFWNGYSTTFAYKIKRRDEENAESFIVDQIIDVLRNNNEPNNSSILHASELAMFTRRSRAGKLSKKIADALKKLLEHKKLRYFAIYNQTTECWLLFYFQYGGNDDSFNQSVQYYTKLKLFYEMNHNNYHYSVFGYGFRKSNVETGNTFDQVFLCIEDATNYKELNIQELKNANVLFGNISINEVMEFPD